jgi:hypothetical protein
MVVTFEGKLEEGEDETILHITPENADTMLSLSSVGDKRTVKAFKDRRVRVVIETID